MSESKFATIRGRQLSEVEKRARADFVVETGGTVASCHSQIDAIVDKLKGRAGEAYDRYWRD